MTIGNPILRGFNPDPSIVRVGADYYIATSTFEQLAVEPHPIPRWIVVGAGTGGYAARDIAADEAAGFARTASGSWAGTLTPYG